MAKKKIDVNAYNNLKNENNVVKAFDSLAVFIRHHKTFFISLSIIFMLLVLFTLSLGLYANSHSCLLKITDTVIKKHWICVLYYWLKAFWLFIAKHLTNLISGAAGGGAMALLLGKALNNKSS